VPGLDLRHYLPEEPADVGILVQALVGPKGAPGEESFDVVVCTPRWLSRYVREHGPLAGRHYLVVDRWDQDMVLGWLTEAIEAEEAPNWPALGARLGRIGKWEFEDYQS
jgi:hypothetical protein